MHISTDHIHTYVHTSRYPHPPTHPPTHPHTHTQVYAHTPMHAHIHTHTYIPYAYTHSLIHTYTLLSAYMHRRAQQLVKVVAALGPTFIKIGQALSIRTDILPPAYTLALQELQVCVRLFGMYFVRMYLSLCVCRCLCAYVIVFVRM